MKIRSSLLMGFCSGALALGMIAGPVLAQPAPIIPSSENDVPQETLQFMVGDILEIMPVIDATNAQYAWVLTESDTFLQAGRSRFFRVRFIRPATYYLHAEVTIENGSTIRRMFVIEVASRDHDQNAPSAPDSAFVTATPPLDGKNRIALNDGAQSIGLWPVSPDLRPLQLDLDASKDSSGNGDPADDNDVQDSFFASSGTPIQLWFSSLSASREMRVRSGADGVSTNAQSMTVYPENAAITEGILQPTLHIASRSIGVDTVQFSVAYDNGAPSTPTLLRWDFGDGTQSLFNEPTHTYEIPGDHTVTVTVRNLLTGQDIGTAEITVRPEAGTTSSAAGPAASTTSAASSKPAEQNSESSGWFGLSLIIILILLVSAAIGALIIWLLKKMRGGSSLQESLASMEKTIVAKETGKALPALTFGTATPPVIKPATTTTQTPVPTPKKETAPVIPKIDAAAPSWLQKGLEASPKPTPAPSAPAPKPAPSPISAPTSIPTSTPKPSPAPAGDLPPWLAAAQAQPTKPAPAATHAVAPKPAIESPIAPAPIEPTVTKNESTAAPSVPSWLQKGMDAAPVQQAPSAESAPPPAMPSWLQKDSENTQKPDITSAQVAPASMPAEKKEAAKPTPTSSPVQTSKTPDADPKAPAVISVAATASPLTPSAPITPIRPSMPDAIVPTPVEVKKTPDSPIPTSTPQMEPLAPINPAATPSPTAMPLPKPVASPPVVTQAPTPVSTMKPEEPKPAPAAPAPITTQASKPKPIPQDILPAEDTTPVAFIQVDSLDSAPGDDASPKI